MIAIERRYQLCNTSMRHRTILLLLGEKAGMRADVSPVLFCALAP